jgi:hypothetical protein
MGSGRISQARERAFFEALQGFHVAERIRKRKPQDKSCEQKITR